jgi:hypothetical protein
MDLKSELWYKILHESRDGNRPCRVGFMSNPKFGPSFKTFGLGYLVLTSGPKIDDLARP